MRVWVKCVLSYMDANILKFDFKLHHPDIVQPGLSLNLTCQKIYIIGNQKRGKCTPFQLDIEMLTQEAISVRLVKVVESRVWSTAAWVQILLCIVNSGKLGFLGLHSLYFKKGIRKNNSDIYFIQLLLNEIIFLKWQEQFLNIVNAI